MTLRAHTQFGFKFKDFLATAMLFLPLVNAPEAKTPFVEDEQDQKEEKSIKEKLLQDRSVSPPRSYRRCFRHFLCLFWDSHHLAASLSLDGITFGHLCNFSS
jgi:hypothetical protein